MANAGGFPLFEGPISYAATAAKYMDTFREKPSNKRSHREVAMPTDVRGHSLPLRKTVSTIC